MLVGDLSAHSEFARNVDGVIGTDMLKRNRFTIDYRHHKILLEQPDPP